MPDKDISIVTVNSDYSIEIPKHILEKLDLKVGDYIEWKIENNSIILKKKNILSSMCESVPTDYEFYGGNVIRDENDKFDYFDCSTCLYFKKLNGEQNFGVCAKLKSPRSGKLTFDKQAGFGCHVPK